jgi:hypothetical protein
MHLDKQFAPERIIMFGVFFVTLFTHVAHVVLMLFPLVTEWHISCKKIFVKQDSDIPEIDASCTST